MSSKGKWKSEAETGVCVGSSAPVKPLRAYIPSGGSERCFPFAAIECPRAPEQLYTIPGNRGFDYRTSSTCALLAFSFILLSVVLDAHTNIKKI